MRIDASNLIAAQATPVQRPKPPVHNTAESAKPAFEPIDFSKPAKDVSPETSANPSEEQKQPDQKPPEQYFDSRQASHKQSGPHQRHGSHVDITV